MMIFGFIGLSIVMGFIIFVLDAIDGGSKKRGRKKGVRRRTIKGQRW